jgi:hypothetical protein
LEAHHNMLVRLRFLYLFLGHENTSVIIITAMPIILHPTMFVHEVIQYKETFQRIKWRLKLTSGAAWHRIEVRSEAVEVIEGQHGCNNYN